ncbi:two pore domain potassium channel family protein [Altererythrobacter confluentis]|uniref:Two pore domain potassium channel family protein n=1 Tax=Allopontixanthobacter confluentis TaxID=1849021 RepID=A0A6L7GFK9_9SPHN|nr:ion channel [Allopontixanthobacter confluentis]MXP14852.1 two pore domain potassium channel family protein [Allopontixanthobacter confluentis]
MYLQLLVSTVMVLSTVAFHGTGLTVLRRMLREEAQEERAQHVPELSFRTLSVTLTLVIGLFVLHGMEIWLYAFLFHWIGAVPDLETAVYFSTISYAGIGYDDRYISETWRLVSAIEGINGLLLLGWSTAFFVTMASRLARK